MLLSEARTRFSRYAGEGNSFTERLNSVIERLLPEGNFRGTKVPARFVVYQDAAGNEIITLPRELETVLAGAYQAPDPNNVLPGFFWCGRPLPVRNDWYEYSPSGPDHLIGTDAARGIIRMPGRFTTFGDWEGPTLLRIKLEADESPGGTIIFRGYVGASKLFSTSGSRQIEGVALNFVNATVTTTQEFSYPPYAIIKPKTRGRIKLFAVNPDDTLDETLVGWYDPDETNPSYARFKIPACRTDQ